MGHARKFVHEGSSIPYSLFPTRGPRRQVFVAGVAIPSLVPSPQSLCPPESELSHIPRNSPLNGV
jgi:hypothetical protein